MKPSPLPPLPFPAWKPTKDTLHRWVQIVGKLRLAYAPRKNHWWHVTLRTSPRGLTTGMVPHPGVDGFEIELDFLDHAVEVRTAKGAIARMPLRDGLSVADFYAGLVGHLAMLGIEAKILAKPYDLASDEPFATDRVHASYDADAVARFSKVLRWTANVYEEFASRFDGKASPVQFFWHSFDLAHTRFSGRRAPPRPDATPVEAEAYARECASFGFWPGDEDVDHAAFYGYAAPEPKGLTSEPLPKGATWLAEGGMANLAYDDVRQAPDPKKAVLDFCEAVYQAARRRADWAAAEAK